MSFKFPIFEDLFAPHSNDPNAFTMSIKINTFKNNTNNTSLLRQDYYTNISKIGYINGYITNKIKDYGSYILIVNSCKQGGPNAIFCISRSDVLQPGNINILTESHGINNDSIELEWNPGEYPLLKYKYKTLYDKKEGGNVMSYKLIFFIKIISTF